MPLGLACVLAIGVFVKASAWGQETQHLQLQLHAKTLTQALTRSLHGYLEALYAIENFFAGSQEVTRQEFRTFVERSFARHPGLQALSWNARIPDTQREAYEEAMRREGYPDFQITERDAEGQLIRAARRPAYVVVSYTEPLAGNERALGFDTASVPDRLQALQRARDTGQPSATGRLTLVQERGRQFGVLIFVPVYGPGLPRTTVEERRKSLDGYAVGSLRMHDMVEGAMDGVAREGIALALIDATAPVGERLLYRSCVEGGGDADPPAADTPEARHPGLSWATTIELAGRRWELHVTPTPAYLAAHRPWQAWGVLAGGLLFAGLFGGFLLLVTGRTAQVEAVNQQLAIEIAERTRAEEALRQSEAHYRTLFDSHPHPLWVYDLDTLAFLVVNDAAIAHYGYSRGEFLAMTIRDIRPPDDLPALAENLSTLPLGLDTPDHWRHQRKDGSIIDAEVTSHSLRFEGRPARLVLAQDITARTQAEAEREQLQARLRQAYKMEAIGTLAGGIAHDFNNILATILGYTELALDDVSSESATWRQLQEVLTAAHRAKDLVQQILTFSRKSEQPRQPVPLQQIVQDALRLLRASLPTTIAIRHHLNAPSSTVFADPTQMHQVLMNLGSNAEHGMRETGGLLEVHIEELEVTTGVTVAHPPLQPGAYLRLTIADTGCGMAPEIVERIFEPFFTTKGVGEGTGLGLAVVHGIITDHGGVITVMSAPGEGTTFTIYLPRCARAAEATHEEPPLLRGQARVLWVDDEVALARWGEQTLARLGYDVTAYTSSVEALEAFRAAPHHFDLIITDHTMPYLTGEALTQAVRPIRPDIPIILCTGFSHTMTAKKATALGIQAYLTKPLGTRELSVAMRQILDQPYTEGEHHHGPYSAHR